MGSYFQMKQLSTRPAVFSFLLALLFVAGALVGLPEEAEAQQSGDRRTQFRLIVENPDDALEGEIRVRRHREMAQMAAERVEKRLATIGVGDYRVRVLPSNDLEVQVFGRHRAETIKSAVIPPGQMDIRPVLVDDTPWMDLEELLPDDIELRAEPGSFQTDRLYLYSPNASSLHSFLGRVSLGAKEIYIFPHRDGWRTLALGESLATERAVEGVSMHRTPSAIPFVRVQLNEEAVDEIRTGARREDARHLAILLDGEIVSLVRFGERHFSSELTLEVPEYLRTSDARSGWAMQVAGRLAAPIPIILAEAE